MIKIKELFVPFVIVLSGSLIPFVFSDSMDKWLLVTLFFLMLCVYRFSARAGRIDFVYYLAIIIFATMTCISNLDLDSLGTYAGLAVRLSIGFFVCLILSPQQFFAVYARFFYLYAWVSLVFYISGAIFPDLIFSLPITHNDAGTGYRHIFIYFYQGVDSWNYRNAGLFWEGGAYASFLFFALLISLHLRSTASKILVILMAILSTGSTIGIASSIVILIASDRLGIKQKLYSILLFLCLIPMSFDIFVDIFISKFDENNISYLDRSIGMIADLILFMSSPFFGLGFSEYNSRFPNVANSLGAFSPTSTNSFTGMLAVFGFFYTILVFLPILLFLSKQSMSGIQAVAVTLSVIMIYSSQGLVNFPLSYIFLFYGVRMLKAPVIVNYNLCQHMLRS